MATFPQLIPDGAIDTTIPPDEFEQSFADTLGNAATDADGFPALFNDAALALDGFSSVLSALDGFAADLSAAVAPLDSVLEQDALDALNSAISTGDPLLSAISGTLPDLPSVTVPPITTAPPAPPTQQPSGGWSYHTAGGGASTGERSCH